MTAAAKLRKIPSSGSKTAIQARIATWVAANPDAEAALIAQDEDAAGASSARNAGASIDMMRVLTKRDQVHPVTNECAGLLGKTGSYDVDDALEDDDNLTHGLSFAYRIISAVTVAANTLGPMVNSSHGRNFQTLQAKVCQVVGGIDNLPEHTLTVD